MPRKLVLLLIVCCVGVAACDSTGPVSLEPHEIPVEDLLEGDIVVHENPSGIAPLTAEATFRTVEPVTVTIEVLGAERLVHRFEQPATDHTVPILGLYPGTENRVVLRMINSGLEYGLDTLVISTDPLPAFLPDVEIVKADETRMEPGWTLSSLSIGITGDFRSYPIMFDNDGTIRWYLNLEHINGMVIDVRRLANGNLLGGSGGALFELDMLGREVHRWENPGYWNHHEIIEKPDGNLIAAVNKNGLETVEDHIIEIDRTTGAIVNEWDLRQILDVHRRDFSTDPVDWFHMNAIWYSEADDALIVSGRTQGVVKITRDNELVWILAPHKGWGNAGPNADGHDTSDFLLTAVDADGTPYPDAVQQGETGAPDFQWSWGQHAPLLLPNGHLFLFDNGANRNFSNAGPHFSRGVEYEIDESNGTVRQVWQYGEERGDAFFSSIISDVDVLPVTRNRMIMPGIVFGSDSYALATEVTYPGKRLVFEAKIGFRNLRAPGNMAWGNFDLVYRSERMPIYPGTAPLRTPRSDSARNSHSGVM